MKKFLSALLVALFFVNASSLSAIATSTISTDSADDLYVATKACPAGYAAYAADRIDDFINSIDPAELPASGKITVGTPFSFANSDSDIFYFPVLCDGEIFYLLRVFPKETGGYGGVFSKMLVDELNNLANKTAYNSPLSIVMDGNEIVACIGKERNTLYTYSDNVFPDDTTASMELLSTNSSDLTVVSATNENLTINYTTSIAEIKEAAISTASTRATPTSLYLYTTITETQGGESWCAAYCLAQIVRYFTGDNTSAQTIMNYFYVTPTDNHNLNPNQVVTYANLRGLSPSYAGVLSNTILMNQLYQNGPATLRTMRSGATGVYHDIVLRGYNSSTQVWSVWNPWYPEYDHFDFNGTYVPMTNTSREYIYFATHYNW